MNIVLVNTAAVVVVALTSIKLRLPAERNFRPEAPQLPHVAASIQQLLWLLLGMPGQPGAKSQPKSTNSRTTQLSPLLPLPSPVSRLPGKEQPQHAWPPRPPQQVLDMCSVSWSVYTNPPNPCPRLETFRPSIQTRPILHDQPSSVARPLPRPFCRPGQACHLCIGWR